MAEDDTGTGVQHMLIRRNDTTREHAYLCRYSRRPVSLRAPIAVAGQRWRIEESFHVAQGLDGSTSTTFAAGASGIAGPP